ncbi:hypothetical protein BYT27DRAFT_7128458 [Phlegmacium glaucopus]|nr:hypothetical protein BYT27DRAFT_7128458 [Phlegmacium glaucopus]
MCRYRRVCNLYLQCGHRVEMPDELVCCSSVNCKFSPNHSPICMPPKCNQTCFQYLQYPEQYCPHINRSCPSCCR